MGQFAAVIDGMAAACEALGTPITGGNVSFYNETLGEAIYPTPVIGVVGILEDISRRATPHFARSGHDVLLLAPSASADRQRAEIELGSIEYVKDILGVLVGRPQYFDCYSEGSF